MIAETPEHKQGHSLLMKTKLRRRRMKLGPTDAVVAESPMKSTQDSTVPSSLPMPHLMRRSSFYSEKPCGNFSKYAKLEERMTQKVASPPSQKFDSTYVAGSFLTSPRRITPKALFGSLLSPSPSDKASSNLPRKLNLKSPLRSVGSCALPGFKSPTKTAGGSSMSTGLVATPPRSTSSGLSHFDLDSPSRNTRSHVCCGKQGSQSETAAAQQSEMLASPSGLGRRSSRLMSPLRGPVSSPDAKLPDRRPSGHVSHVAKSSEIYFGRSFQSCDVAANRKPECPTPERAISSSCIPRVQLTKCGVNAVEMSSDHTSNTSPPDHSSCSVEKAPDEGTESDKRLAKKKKKKRLSFSQSPPFTTTLRSSEKSTRPTELSVEEAEGIGSSSGIKLLADTSEPGNIRMSHKRKKSVEDVTCKPSARKRPHRESYPVSHSSEQGLSSIVADVYNRQSEGSALLTTLSFGCDLESDDAAVVGQYEKVHSDALCHLGSSGVESESSSNDVDLMMTRKHLLNRKCSSGFQSLGHISETDDCRSPVFPTISNEAKVSHYGQHSASISVSASPVFGKRQVPSLAGDSPCVSLSGSGRKRTPLPGSSESFSPDLSQHSIAHLMTSPLVGAAEAGQKTGRNRPSTRRCLDEQMYQSGKRLSTSRHSSAKLTDDDN